MATRQGKQKNLLRKTTHLTAASEEKDVACCRVACFFFALHGAFIAKDTPMPPDEHRIERRNTKRVNADDF